MSFWFYHDEIVHLLTADRRAKFETLELTEDDYEKELEHIEQVRVSS